MVRVWVGGGWGWTLNTIGDPNAKEGVDYTHRDGITITDPMFFDCDIAWKTNDRGETTCRRTILGSAVCRPVADNHPMKDTDPLFPEARRYVLAFPNDIHHGVYTERQILRFFRAGIRYVKAHKL